MAGLFEGEGCVSISRPNKSNGSLGALHTTVSNTDKDLITALNNAFPGALSETNPKGRKGTVYRWDRAGQGALAFLDAIYMHLASERQSLRAELGMAYQRQKGPPGRKASHDYRERQRHFFEIMKLVNTRGVAALPTETANKAMRLFINAYYTTT